MTPGLYSNKISSPWIRTDPQNEHGEAMELLLMNYYTQVRPIFSDYYGNRGPGVATSNGTQEAPSSQPMPLRYRSYRGVESCTTLVCVNRWVPSRDATLKGIVVP
ncbi:hypothetical protein RF11_12498 [Thelohanellus kitauei]|uniref:Uncharacterized protein n=1 Tax=Thelohanellus kitauei TaxID=669202 RepID=A0A0C2N0R2_THEKT|nr:hypothetical protein RF11_12498 [Thelohanellus kitauei]